MYHSTVMVLLLFVFLIVELQSVQTTGSDLAEYCMFSNFEPRCEDSEVVIIHEAVYGRMRIGKCLEGDYRIGCKANILELLDQLCSGVQSCNVPLPNTQLRNAVKCLNKGLTGYLEASYGCQKVYKPRQQNCKSPEKIMVYKESKIIASEISKDTSCGILGTPWLLEAQPGQQISIAMTDFSWSNTSIDLNQCPINYGYILDMESDDVFNICGGRERFQDLYQSVGNSVQIVLEQSVVEAHRFLIEFKVIGCPEYIPPDYSWVQKENDSLLIGCVTSDKTWKLQCVDNIWLGMIGNCSKPEESVISNEKNVIEVNNENPVRKESVNRHREIPEVTNNHVIVFVLACLTVIACCIIIITGIFCTKRYNVKITKWKSQHSALNNVNSARFATLRSVCTTYKPGNPPQTTIDSNHRTQLPPAYTFPKQQNTAPQLPIRNAPNFNPAKRNSTNENAYENIRDDESVQYYILENPTDTENSNILT